MKKILVLFFLILSLFIVPRNVSATSFDLINPEGALSRGQDVIFTININTEGESLGSSAIGMTYETQYLEYVSVAPGDTFSTVSADVQGDGKLIITGTSTNPYSGAGAFAYITFKLIATQSGSTQLCVLFNPQTSTPTPNPTTPPDIVPTDVTEPVTALPKTGESKPMAQGIIFATIFLGAASIGLFVFKKT